MSHKFKVSIARVLRELQFHNKYQLTIQDIAALLNQKNHAWLNYYGRIHSRCMLPVFYHLHHRLLKWLANKYKHFKRSKVKAVSCLRRVCACYPNLFYHWILAYCLDA